MPEFAHLPLLLKPEGNGKLSKRDGDRLGFPVFPLEWKDRQSGETSSGYRESGYLPQAVVNFLALLGWNPGTEQEIFTLDELVTAFSFERCSKSGAKFDFEKAKWFNHKYIQETPNELLAEMLQPVLAEKNISCDKNYAASVIGLVKERVNFVKELWDQAYFFFIAPVSYDEKTVSKRWKKESPMQLAELINVLQRIDDFSSENQENIVKQWIEEKSYPLGNIMNAFRLAVVGESKGPHMFDITSLLGKQETIDRLTTAINKISVPENN
jgi:glutamyl-tRNA synthetase